MVEEAAELLHAALKLKQADVHGEEPRYPAAKLQADLFDAVGDCGIYCCSYCNSAGLDFEYMFNALPEPDGDFSLLTLAQQLVMVANTPAQYCAYLRAAARLCGLDAGAVTLEVWKQVRTRSRKQDPAKVRAERIRAAAWDLRFQINASDVPRGTRDLLHFGLEKLEKAACESV
jgi:hypothetical protein